ncbi:MAG TPA: Gfo/Idh/MocA family oxidoreductase [Bryobacteraceae bacterium]|jgi:predicted dehydrogenase|nr:Gfo/Idh/MocA family oxidoreductase [Bryobacteraceae bacterium]
MQNPNAISRRDLIKQSSLLAGAAAFALTKVPAVRAADGPLKAGLVGCGGRGTQAVVDLLTGNEQVELAAMADVFEDHLEQSLARLRDPKFTSHYAGITVERNGQPRQMTAEDLTASIAPRIRVTPDHHFTGFDAYRKLLASDIDIVMLCTPPGFRPLHFEAAVEARKHVFTEKPIATDPVGARGFIATGKLAAERKLTVVSGAQRRAQREYVDTVQKIQDGAIGEVTALYANYLSGPVFHADHRDPKWSDLEWQLRNWYSFIWICGDQVVEQHFHNIDFMNWLMGAHPVKVVASGGAAWRPRLELYGNIYDHMSSDFTYPNGVHLSSHCRQYPKGVYTNVSDTIVGTKGHSNGMDMGAPGINPYVQEHINMVHSIRGDGPYLNYSLPIAESTLTALMARESAYSGQEVTWDQIVSSQLDLMPKTLTDDTKLDPAPLPAPGTYKFI